MPSLPPQHFADAFCRAHILTTPLLTRHANRWSFTTHLEPISKQYLTPRLFSQAIELSHD